MISNILINKQNLIDNFIYVKSQTAGKVCVMVKANAYGHGDKDVAKILNDYADFFGVSNLTEAMRVKEVSEKQIIVFGECEDYFKCMASGIGFALFSFEQTKKIVEIYKHSFVKPKMHLCINTGMNRYGVNCIKECKKIIALLQKFNLQLEGLYTHFSSLTTDEKYTTKQIEKFEDFRALIPAEWDTIIHVGGGRSIYNDYKTDMHRVGLFIYGYGDNFVKPVLSIESRVVDIVKVKKGEHVGYLCGYTADQDSTVATIPLGYGDGLSRALSNKLQVKINGVNVRNVGNICMDSFMVDVSHIKCNVGDRVLVCENIQKVASIMCSTEYEALTNLTKFRGDRKIT